MASALTCATLAIGAGLLTAYSGPANAAPVFEITGRQGGPAAADVAAPALTQVPLPPVLPKEAAEGPAEVAFRDAPLPPLRPLDEDLPWLVRPVVPRTVAAQVSSAVGDLLANDFADALATQEKMDDPTGRTLIEFLYVRDGSSHASWRRIARFLEEHPGWPSRELLQKRLEIALLSQKASSEQVLEHLSVREPLTNLGRIALAQAYLAEGRKDDARELAGELWRRMDLTRAEEGLVDERLGKLLTRADHRARAVRLVYDGELRHAASLAKRLENPDKALVETVAGALRGDAKAKKALAALPKETRDQPLALFAKARLARRAGHEEEAGRILMRAPADEDALASPDEWWLEQKLASRWLLERGRASEAYELTLKHAANSAAERSDAEWQAGWIALRFLDDPEAAIGHFTEAEKVVSRPISLARGEYWLGRAYEAKGDKTRAREHYAAAGKHYSTYYGQLAIDRLGEDRLPQPHKPLFAHSAVRWAEAQDSYKSIRLLMQIGYQDLASQLMISMARETDSPAMIVAVAELAHRTGMHTTALTIGKLGTYALAPTEYYAFTVDGLPAYPVIGTPVDPALVYAIARQESVFNPKAQSHAGARGLMQLMPATARLTARAHGQAYAENRLLQDPTYNVMIGAAHLGQLMNNFDGAYPMVFAAYNAGGGRVHEWNERFGDPRKGEIDAVDWVEFIPYGETRNYVQRVMEGMQVYRARLGHGEFQIAEDLGIDRVGNRPPLAATAAGKVGAVSQRD